MDSSKRDAWVPSLNNKKVYVKMPKAGDCHNNDLVAQSVVNIIPNNKNGRYKTRVVYNTKYNVAEVNALLVRPLHQALRIYRSVSVCNSRSYASVVKEVMKTLPSHEEWLVPSVTMGGNKGQGNRNIETSVPPRETSPLHSNDLDTHTDTKQSVPIDILVKRVYSSNNSLINDKVRENEDSTVSFNTEMLSVLDINNDIRDCQNNNTPTENNVNQSHNCVQTQHDYVLQTSNCDRNSDLIKIFDINAQDDKFLHCLMFSGKGREVDEDC